MSNGCFKVRRPENEAILTYNEDSYERAILESKIAELKQKHLEKIGRASCRERV